MNTESQTPPVAATPLGVVRKPLVAVRVTPKISVPSPGPELIGGSPSAEGNQTVSVSEGTLSGAPQETGYFNPVVVILLDAITHEAKILATVDGSQIPVLAATVSVMKKLPPLTMPANPPGIFQVPGGTPGRGEKPVFGARPGPKGRKVMVLSVDQQEYTGTWKHGTEIDNCALASRELGCVYNAVLKAFKRREDGLETSTVYGVTFCYVDDFTAHINRDVRVD